MNIICLSASNTKLMGEKSASTKVCHLIKEMITEKSNDAKVEVVPLLQYNLIPCTFCGVCSKDGTCPFDNDFNTVYEKIIKADAVIIVTPYYSTIPVKLTMILEKMNEIFYAGWLGNSKYIPPIYQKSFGIIGHGGMPETEQSLKYYHTNLITPIANTLRGLGGTIVSVRDEFPNGTAFGLENENCIKNSETQIFPEITQNYEKISQSIEPLVHKIISKIAQEL